MAKQCTVGDMGTLICIWFTCINVYSHRIYTSDSVQGMVHTFLCNTTWVVSIRLIVSDEKRQVYILLKRLI